MMPNPPKEQSDETITYEELINANAWTHEGVEAYAAPKVCELCNERPVDRFRLVSEQDFGRLALEVPHAQGEVLGGGDDARPIRTELCQDYWALM